MLSEQNILPFFFVFLFFRDGALRHMEAYGDSQAWGLIGATARATATPDPSHVFELYHSSQQRRILNPLSEARDRTCNFMVPSQICFRCATTWRELWAKFSSSSVNQRTPMLPWVWSEGKVEMQQNNRPWEAVTHTHNLRNGSWFFFSFYGCTCGIWKFLDQGSN